MASSSLQSDLSIVDIPDHVRTRYRLAAPTFATICNMAPSPDRRLVFTTACSAIEFQTFPIRPLERAWLRHVNDHSNIAYPIHEPLTEPWHKVSLLVQIDLSGQPWPPNNLTRSARKTLHADRGPMYKALDHVVRCIIDVLGHRADGRGMSVALDVLRSLHAKVWEGAPDGLELLQVQGIGAARLKRLTDAGVRTVRRLAALEFFHIERLMSRNPPYGQTLLRQLAGFPLLTLQLESLGPAPSDAPLVQEKQEWQGRSAAAGPAPLLWMVRARLAFTNTQVPVWKGKTPWVSLVMEKIKDDDEDGDGKARQIKHDDEDGYGKARQIKQGSLLWFWRGSIKRLDGGPGGKEMVIGLAAHKGCQLRATLACEVLVGTMVQQNLLL